MCCIVSDNRTFGHEVCGKIPHTQCCTLLDTLDLLFNKFKRIFDIMVHEILCKSIIFSHKDRNVGRTGKVHAKVHTNVRSDTMCIRCHSSDGIGYRFSLCDGICKSFRCGFSVRKSLYRSLCYGMTCTTCGIC